MRVLIDATAVNDGGGGMVTYLRGLLRGWNESGFGDHLSVIGTWHLPADIDQALDGIGTVYRSGNSRPGARVVTQQMSIPQLTGRLKPDVILATTPVVPLLVRHVPIVAMIHDFRHIHRPLEFGTVQRRYRQVAYRAGINRATRLIANSMMTRQDASQLFPRAAAKIDTVYLGCDQMTAPSHGLPKGSHALAFAHWSNKRPDVAIQAWGVLKAQRSDFANPLHVVGVRDEQRAELAAIAARAGVTDLIRFHGHLAEQSYWELFATAQLVVMPSTFEGFGLPIIEAMRLRVAAVASDNAGMQEAGGDNALYATMNSPEAFATQCACVLFDDALRASLLERGYRHAQNFTWGRTAQGTRDAFLRATASAAISQPTTGR